ncbi:MAG: TIGR02757 family protein [Saprospiraceae bacterium]|uniref:TIGR02757 family protein n=1 Tax=Candidatus Opimibacter skivensis TaxID=2982028 RepID=A0A9D7SSN8_9BACT|nr:TIGR02757 family protein [Candidatus Opimibacter skivensis]
MLDDRLQIWLDEKADAYNQPSFISLDPISVPHQFSLLQDIEIAGFFAAIMAWGQRPTIINKSNELLRLMDGAPHQFITQHQERDRKRFFTFKHRTLQPDDIIFLSDALQRFYQKHDSLEDAFADHMTSEDKDVYNGLAGFYNIVFDHPWVMERTRKHIATPERKSACKRLNMYLRWMVRQDDKGVDFGLWKRISPSQLVIPLDLHVGNVARQLGLLDRKINDWQAAKELTDRLKEFDSTDPVKYDFALFGAGINGM